LVKVAGKITDMVNPRILILAVATLQGKRITFRQRIMVLVLSDASCFNWEAGDFGYIVKLKTICSEVDDLSVADRFPRAFNGVCQSRRLEQK
jgi:hypothetical protein